MRFDDRRRRRACRRCPSCIAAGIVASVSASACCVDHRTLANSERGNGRPRRAPTSQKPPSLAGPNTSSCRPSRREGPRDVAWPHRRNVAADQHERTGRQQPERPLHALAEIALPLRPRAVARCQAGWSRTWSGVTNNQTVQRRSRDKVRIWRSSVCAIEAHRRDRSDRRRQPPLHASELRGAGEDHEVTLHRVQPPDEAGRQAGKIERKAAEVAHGAQQPAVAFVALGRGDGLGVEG